MSKVSCVSSGKALKVPLRMAWAELLRVEVCEAGSLLTCTMGSSSVLLEVKNLSEGSDRGLSLERFFRVYRKA